MTLEPTPAQTVGPFFAFGLAYDGDSALVPPGRAGAIRLHGRVLDGEGNGVPDALVEVWQPDTAGAVVQAAGSLHRDGFTFTGWGRAATDRTGTWSFCTVVPGPTAAGHAPYFALAVFARGLVHGLFTRAYLPVTLLPTLPAPVLPTRDPTRDPTQDPTQDPDQDPDQDSVQDPTQDPFYPDDPFLASLDPERRATLIAEADDRGFVFDIRLQGRGETGRGETGRGETVFLSYGGRSD